MTPIEFACWLGKEAGQRQSYRTRSVPVRGANAAANIHKALHDPVPDARQLPRSYGFRVGRPSVPSVGDVQPSDAGDAG
jgi:hypothetical protein